MLDVFIEIHTGLPRQGPGDKESTAKSLSMMTHLPDNPCILDVGCGTGAQTLHLASLTKGEIIAVEIHLPFVEFLQQEITRLNLTNRVHAQHGDMTDLKFEENIFDIIWSEGAIYQMGFQNGLIEWKRFLKPGGYIAVTEISWLKPDLPTEIEEYWKREYSAITNIEENLKSVRNAGYQLKGHFTLPESSWLDNYYYPIEKRLDYFRNKYQDDAAALAVIASEQTEIDMYRRYSEYYGYVFYIMRLPT